MGDQFKSILQIRTFYEFKPALGGFQRRTHRRPADGIGVPYPSIHGSPSLKAHLNQNLQRNLQLPFTGEAAAIRGKQSLQSNVGERWHHRWPAFTKDAPS